jgi:uncharacterized protein (TIGR02597 family)
VALGALVTFAIPSRLAAQSATATTDPVGFITLTVNGASAGTTALSFKALGLARQVEYQGNAEQVGANSLTDNDATWTDNQFNGANGAYYLEITGPTGASGIGTTYDITGTTAATHTVTLAQNLAAGVTTGATFRIRKHWTIAAVFGAANEGGLAGGTSTTADTIRIYNTAGVYTAYYYSTAAGDVGWRKTDASGVEQSGDQSGVVIYPDDGLVIARQQASAANIVLMGAVKTGQTSSPISSGLNFVANPYAAPMTLGDSGLYTGDPNTGVKSGGASNADLVRIYNGTGYDSYFYSSGGLAGVGWRKVSGGTADQANVQIPVGASVIIQRQGATGFNWVAAQHPASF